MTKEQLYEGIGLSEAAREIAERNQISEEEYLEWKSLFYEDKKAFFEKGKGEKNFSQKALTLCLRMALDAWEEFKKAGFTEAFYFLNMKDIAIWNRVHEQKYGIPGLNEIGWLGMSIEQKLYRIGRLQFEPMKVDKDIKVCGKLLKKGQPLLNVHIPEDGRLDPRECEEAFQKAKEFFEKRGYEGAGIFMCESWLLTPKLKEVLGENSNIIQFQNRFDIYDIIYPFRQTEERVFGKIQDDKSAYPEKSSLQKAVKERLLRDPSDLGMGIGIFKL